MIEAHILTGFLGSGKTTLLRHLLARPELADTAVVINEFGEVGLDHFLVREVAEDAVLLQSGCLCCTVRDDLVSTLARMQALAEAGEAPRFSRAVIETTGLADPAPVAAAILSDRRLSAAYRLGRIVTAIDATCGLATLQRHDTAVQQAALADTLVVTKADLAEEDGLALLKRRLSEINPDAERLLSSREEPPSPASLLKPPAKASAGRSAAAAAGADAAGARHGHGGASSFPVAFKAPVARADFVEWLELLLAARGDDILRVKGLLAVKDEPRPLVVQGVQHVVYPLEALAAWPPGAASQLVFITRGIPHSAVARSLEDFLKVEVA
ncbi:CobW family GTP-binding protein [Afifella pfennigii]|uniref:CobW family GTP-binding protein n=1 Tax=Afifella pfennigii TaxID=209897 RepID=UPI00069209CB|nr:GTP-binding protein [Afifella pfennigii]